MNHQDNAVTDSIQDVVRFNADGLVPAIARQAKTGEILMMAWMSRETLAETLATRQVCYWSRSRNRPWRKGETSGQRQTLVDIYIDCDGDTLLLDVDQSGVACHTGRRSCFYRRVEATGDLTTISEPEIDPETLYGS